MYFATEHWCTLFGIIIRGHIFKRWGRNQKETILLFGEDIIRYYRSRFQIEFLYRDAKQYTGSTNSQARSENKLDFHFNASLTAVNLAKMVWMEDKGNQHKPFSMANYKTLYNNTLVLELFIRKFAIKPNTAKNQKIVQKLLEYGKIVA